MMVCRFGYVNTCVSVLGFSFSVKASFSFSLALRVRSTRVTGVRSSPTVPLP